MAGVKRGGGAHECTSAGQCSRLGVRGVGWVTSGRAAGPNTLLARPRLAVHVPGDQANRVWPPAQRRLHRSTGPECTKRGGTHHDPLFGGIGGVPPADTASNPSRNEQQSILR